MYNVYIYIYIYIYVYIYTTCFNLFILNNSFDNQGREINKNDIFLRFGILSFTNMYLVCIQYIKSFVIFLLNIQSSYFLKLVAVLENVKIRGQDLCHFRESKRSSKQNSLFQNIAIEWLTCHYLPNHCTEPEKVWKNFWNVRKCLIKILASA